MVGLPRRFRRRPLFETSAESYARVFRRDLEGDVQVDDFDFNGLSFTPAVMAAAVVVVCTRARDKIILHRRNHYVVRLKISVAYVVPVKVLDRLEKLAHDASDDILAQHWLRLRLATLDGCCKCLLATSCIYGSIHFR